MTQTIEIKKAVAGKFGPQVLLASGKFASFSPRFAGNKEPEPGVYEAEIYTTDKGNMYLNTLTKTESGVDIAAKEWVKGIKENAPKRKSKVASVPEVKEVDWDNVNRGKVRCALVVGLLSNPNLLASLNEVTVDNLRIVVDPLVDYVMGDK